MRKTNIDGSNLMLALEILYARHLIRKYLDKKYCNNNTDARNRLKSDGESGIIHEDYNKDPNQAPAGTTKDGEKIGGQFVSNNTLTVNELFDKGTKSGSYRTDRVNWVEQGKHFPGSKSFIEEMRKGNIKTYFTIPKATVDFDLRKWFQAGTKIAFPTQNGPEVRVIFKHDFDVGNAYWMDEDSKFIFDESPTPYIEILIDSHGLHGYPIRQERAEQLLNDNEFREKVIQYQRNKQKQK